MVKKQEQKFVCILESCLLCKNIITKTMDIKEATKLLSQVKNTTHEKVREILYNTKMRFLSTANDTLVKGNILYRATIIENEDEINDIKRLSYKPANLNKSYGRASTPYNTMFYGLSSNNNYMLGVLGSMSEVCPCIRNNRTAENKYYKVVISEWKVVSEINVVMISDPDAANRSQDMKDPTYGKLLNREQKKFVKHISNAFREEVTKENEYNYWISATFTEIMTKKMGFDGICYESVQSSAPEMKENLCIALCPEIADRCLKFIGGELYEFNFIKGENIVPRKTKCIIQVGEGKIEFTSPHSL